MNEIIATENLSKTYKEVKAVSNLSISVGKGEIYGFLGLNGAGKTTTIRMLLGMINPSEGKAYIKGKQVFSGSIDLWKDVGYLVEVPYAYPELTVKQNLEIFRRLRKVSDKDAINIVMDRLKISKYSNRKARHLSLGNAQRLGLAKSLIHNPSVLLLDEPSNGLDLAGIQEIRELLVDLAKNHGITVFISSHILDEVSRFATRIGIIHDGKLIEEIDSEQLKKLCKKELLLNTGDNEKAISILKEKHIIARFWNNFIKIDDADLISHPEIVSSLIVNNNIPLSMIKVEEEDLESYFLRTIKNK
ncbi:MAG: ABC transporter ATP-binding protein [Bacteroidales bacterium]|nr:ABC transporter ATP-binding protein [Bacteroidales bacterium]